MYLIACNSYVYILGKHTFHTSHQPVGHHRAIHGPPWQAYVLRTYLQHRKEAKLALFFPYPSRPSPPR